MKKTARRTGADELRDEYDLRAFGPGVKGKYAKALARVTLVALDPEVAAAFPTSDVVNDALRSLMREHAKHQRPLVAKRSRANAARPKR